MSLSPRSRLSTLAFAAALAAATAAPVGAVIDEGQRGMRATGDPPEREAPTVGERAARIALTAVGTPYRYGGETPAAGFDCSGLVRWAYGRLGFELPHSSYALYAQGRQVPRGELRPGDLLFFEGLGHVGLFLGEGRMVHAPQTGRNVEVVRLGGSSYGRRLIGARRVAPA